MAADARGQLWTYLVQKLLPADGHYSRIESHTSAGFPDVHYTVAGVSGTIELKDTKRPGAKYPFSGQSGLRDSQIRWIEDELEARGKVLLILQCEPTLYLLNGLYAFTKPRLDRMTAEDLQRHCITAWSKPCSIRDLVSVRTILRRQMTED